MGEETVSQNVEKEKKLPVVEKFFMGGEKGHGIYGITCPYCGEIEKVQADKIEGYCENFKNKYGVEKKYVIKEEEYKKAA